MDGSGRRTEDGRFATRNPLSAICPSSCHNYRRAEWTSLEDEPSTSALPYVLPTARSTARPSVRPSLSPSLCPFLCLCFSVVLSLCRMDILGGGALPYFPPFIYSSVLLSFYPLALSFLRMSFPLFYDEFPAFLQSFLLLTSDICFFPT